MRRGTFYSRIVDTHPYDSCRTRSRLVQSATSAQILAYRKVITEVTYRNSIDHDGFHFVRIAKSRARNVHTARHVCPPCHSLVGFHRAATTRTQHARGRIDSGAECATHTTVPFGVRRWKRVDTVTTQMYAHIAAVTEDDRIGVVLVRLEARMEAC
jgi:hypothetical protein